MYKNQLFSISFLLFFFFLTPLCKNYSGVYAQEKFTVVLDAGHGGHDPGNLGNGYLEKNIALNIVLRAGRILERNPEIEVVYTRKDDTFIDLFVRGEIANKAKADLFVSVHCDSHTSDAHGAGTFVLGLHANEQNFEIAKKENSVIYLEDNYATRYADYDINSPESVIGLTIMQEEFLDQSVALAKSIQDNFSNKLKRKDRKVKQAGFIVLHQTFMPSVLVETGFLTNDDEGAYLNSGQGQSEMGTAIADAILNYKRNAVSSVGQESMSSMPSAPDPENAETELAVAEVPEESSNMEVVAESATTKSVDQVNSKTDEVSGVINEAPSVAQSDVKKMLDEAEQQAVESIDKEKIEAPTSPDPKTVVDEKPETKTEVVVTETNEAGRPKIVKEEIKPITKPEVTKNESEEMVFDNEPKVEEKPRIVPEVKKEATASVNIEFRVQLMASGKDLLPTDPIFKGLGEISKEPVKKLYRYMHGRTDSFIKAKLLKKVADAKGFTTSFLVAYKDGVRIDVEEAKKYVSE